MLTVNVTRREARFNLHMSSEGRPISSTHGLKESEVIARLKKCQKMGMHARVWQVNPRERHLHAGEPLLIDAGGCFLGANGEWYWDFAMHFTARKKAVLTRQCP